MNITYDEAWKIAGDIVAEGQNKEPLTKEMLATLIFRNHDYRWNNEADKWEPNEATTAVHVAELQDESEELHRKLKATRERCDILEGELSRLKARDRMVIDSENLRHITNKLDSLNAPTEVNGEPLVLPVDRLAYLLSLMRQSREAAEAEGAKIQAHADSLSNRVAELSIELGTKLREFDALETRFKAVSRALVEAREAINDVNEKLRTATLCKCMVVEVTEGRWETFRTADCPVHPHTIEVNWP